MLSPENPLDTKVGQNLKKTFQPNPENRGHAMKFKLSYNWKDKVSDVRLDSHRATMAEFIISVGEKKFTKNEPLTLSEDEDNFPKNSIFVSLFPLAEFIAANWWPLVHEQSEKIKVICSANKIDFKRRHWINSHTDGFAYPEVGFFGADSAIKINSNVSSIESANIQYTETSGGLSDSFNGTDRLEVEGELLEFIRLTIERLPSNDDKIWLADAFQRIETSRKDPDELLYCKCAGLLGADPYDPDSDAESAIFDTVSILGKSLAIELFATAEAFNVTDKAIEIKKQVDHIVKRSSEASTHIHGLKTALGLGSLSAQQPWMAGYEAANKLRNLQDISAFSPLYNIDDVSKLLVNMNSRFITTNPNIKQLGLRSIISNNGSGLSAMILADLNKSADAGKFQLASAFSDFLFSDEDELFFSTQSVTDRQKRNKAFAAELLAPINGIRERFSMTKSIDENTSDIARQFNVSSYVVRYQLQNQAPELISEPAETPI